MKPARHLALACSAALLLGAFAAPAQSSRTNNPAPPAPAKSSGKSSSKSSAKSTPAPPAPATGTFDDFKAIPDRNIFNTRRYAGRTQTDTPPPQQRRNPVIESFSLLGTLEYEKGRVAFFEGSGSGMKKSAKVDDTIGDCKITAIEAAAVTLEANGKPVELKVGYMLRREDQGEWKSREAERPTDYGFGSSSGFGSGFNSGSSFGSSSSRFSSSGSSQSSRFSSGSSRDSRSSSSSSFNRDPRSNSSFGGSSNPAEMAQSRIREQDRNGDGRISRDEADSRLRDRFREIDRNGDGSVDGEEYTAYYVSRFGGGSSSSGSSGSSFNQGGTFNSGGTFNNSSSPGGSPGSFNSGSPSSPPSGSPSSGGGESDLLRRLMEQRARENR